MTGTVTTTSSSLPSQNCLILSLLTTRGRTICPGMRKLGYINQIIGRKLTGVRMLIRALGSQYNASAVFCFVSSSTIMTVDDGTLR